MTTEQKKRDARAAKFWTCNADEERLSATSIGEAVQEWADGLDLLDGEKIPATVKVHGFAQMDMPSAELLADDALERLLEWLDEEHADPEGDRTTPTDAMKAAALAFTTAVLDDYKNWCCEKVDEVTVNVGDYVPADWPVAEVGADS